MRLIDADKIPYVQDVTYMKDYDYAYRYAIEAEPAVDAIPIEWIQNWGNKEGFGFPNWLREMISDWKKEQENEQSEEGSEVE